MRDESVSLMNDVWLLVLRLSRTLSASTLRSLWTAGSRLTGSTLKVRARDVLHMASFPRRLDSEEGNSQIDIRNWPQRVGWCECCSLLLMFVNTLQSSGDCE